MAIKNEQLYISYRAWNKSTRSGIAGDGGNHTLNLISDGVEAVIANAITDLGDGQYRILLTKEQMDANSLTLRPVSSTPGVIIYSILILTDQGLTKQILQLQSSSSSSSSA